MEGKHSENTFGLTYIHLPIDIYLHIHNYCSATLLGDLKLPLLVVLGQNAHLFLQRSLTLAHYKGWPLSRPELKHSPQH